MADAYDTMTAEQLAAERKRLAEAAAGLDALRKTLPESYTGLGVEEYGTAGLPSQMNPQHRALDAETAAKQQELNAQRAAVEAAVARSEDRKLSEAARAQVLAATGGATSPKTMEQALMEGGNAIEPSGGPVAAQVAHPQEDQYKTIIGSRRDPLTGKITFETQRVRATDVPVDLGQFPTQGANDWQNQALGENAQRAAATRAFQLAHPEQTTYSPETGLPTTGFQVRAGAGGFSPSTPIPSAAMSPEEVLATQSPLVADMWFERKARADEARARAGALQDVETRRRLGTAQAGLAERQLAEQTDPTIVTRGRIASYDLMQQKLGSTTALAIESFLRTVRQNLEAAGQPPAMVEAAVKAMRDKKIEEKSGLGAVRDFNAALSAIEEPTVAAAQIRQTLLGQ